MVRAYLRSIVTPLIPLIIFLGVWEVWHNFNYFGLFPVYLLPPPSGILGKLWELILSGVFVAHIGATLQRVVTAYVIAIATAVPLGLALGWYNRLYKAMEPIVELLRPIPAVGLLSFGLLVFGIGSAPIIFIATYGCFFTLLIASLYGTYSVDEITVLVMRSMKSTNWRIFRNVVLPSALPYIFGGLRQSIATAWILVVAGEMIMGNAGLGSYVVETQRTFQIPAMYATLMLLGILGYASTRVLLTVENALLTWRKVHHTAP